jgi:hypothetical protein
MFAADRVQCHFGGEMGWLQFFSSPTPAQLARRKRDELRRMARKPHVGATICCADLRMSVQTGMSNELWRWLVGRGWRALDDTARRHRLRALPSSAVTAPFDAVPERWEGLLAAAMKEAIRKPTIETGAVRVAA